MTSRTPFSGRTLALYTTDVRLSKGQEMRSTLTHQVAPDTTAICGARGLALSVLILVSAAASAQVNTEAFRPVGPEDGLSGTLSLTFAARRGNSESERAGLGLNLFRATAFVPKEAEKAKRPVQPELLTAKRLLMLVAEYDFEESKRDNTVNRGFAHLRWTLMRSPRLGWEAFAQLEKDEFTRLERRTLVGGGLRYGAYQRNRAKMFVGIGAMGEWERIEERTAPSTESRLTRDVVRISSYFNARWQHSNERVEASTTTYMQPSVEDTDDYRILSQARLTTSITERIGLNLIVNLRHDSQPPLEIEHTDLDVKMGLSLRL